MVLKIKRKQLLFGHKPFEKNAMVTVTVLFLSFLFLKTKHTFRK